MGDFTVGGNDLCNDLCWVYWRCGKNSVFRKGLMYSKIYWKVQLISGWVGLTQLLVNIYGNWYYYIVLILKDQFEPYINQKWTKICKETLFYYILMSCKLSLHFVDDLWYHIDLRYSVYSHRFKRDTLTSLEEQMRHFKAFKYLGIVYKTFKDIHNVLNSLR